MCQWVHFCAALEDYHTKNFVQVHKTLINIRQSDKDDSSVWVLDAVDAEEDVNIVLFPPPVACTTVPTQETMDRLPASLTLEALSLSVRRLPTGAPAEAGNKLEILIEAFGMA